jgi:hypothetical protein
MPPSPADFIHARACKPFCEKSLTLPPRFSQGRILINKWQVQSSFSRN